MLKKSTRKIEVACVLNDDSKGTRSYESDNEDEIKNVKVKYRKRTKKQEVDLEPALKKAKPIVDERTSNNNGDGTAVGFEKVPKVNEVEIKKEPGEQITKCQCVECPELVKNNRIKTFLSYSSDQNHYINLLLIKYVKDILNPKLPGEYFEEEDVIVKIKATGKAEPKPEYNIDLEEQKIVKPDSPGEYFEEEDVVVKIKAEPLTEKTEPKLHAPVIKDEPEEKKDFEEQKTQNKDDLKYLSWKYSKLKELYYGLLSKQQESTVPRSLHKESMPPFKGNDLMKFYSENQDKITESIRKVTKKHPNWNITKSLFEPFIQGIQLSLESKQGIPQSVTMDVTKPPPMSSTRIKEYYNTVGKQKFYMMKVMLDESKLEAKEFANFLTLIEEAAIELNF